MFYAQLTSNEKKKNQILNSEKSIKTVFAPNLIEAKSIQGNLKNVEEIQGNLKNFGKFLGNSRNFNEI